MCRELHLDSAVSRKITPRPRAKELPQISDAHRVEDFKVYCIMKAGVNAGLSDEGMVKQEVYHRKIFDKFLDTVRSEAPPFFEYMKTTFPEQGSIVKEICSHMASSWRCLCASGVEPKRNASETACSQYCCGNLDIVQEDD